MATKVLCLVYLVFLNILPFVFSVPVRQLKERQGVILYSQINFEGLTQFLPLGAWTIPKEINGETYTISSVRVMSGTQVSFYQYENFTGIETLPITSDVSNTLESGLSQLISAILIERAPGVMIYEESEMKGRSQYLPYGEYDYKDLYKNDDVSSISLSFLTKVELYENSNFQGFRLDSIVDLSSLPPSIDNRVSSIKVKKVWSCMLYSEPVFGGDAQYLSIGDHSKEKLYKPDQIGSIRVPKGLKATVFKNGKFEGEARVFERNWLDLKAIGFDSISSVRIEPICEKDCFNGKCVEPNVCECNENWTGEACNIALCKPSCVNGECHKLNDNHVCECYLGWEGNSCEIPSCNPKCQRGECRSPDVCVCDDGWTGQQCQYLEKNCGDGYCSKYESCSSCEKDCGSCKSTLNSNDETNEDGNEIKPMPKKVKEKKDIQQQQQSRGTWNKEEIMRSFKMDGTTVAITISLSILGLLMILTAVLKYVSKSFEKSKIAKKGRGKQD